MIIPTVASLSEDALSAVPQSLRQGSYALGANTMRTTLRVVFPAAISGITASIVLALSRAVGETMIVALAAGTQAQIVIEPTDARPDDDRLHRPDGHRGEHPGHVDLQHPVRRRACCCSSSRFIINMIAGIDRPPHPGGVLMASIGAARHAAAARRASTASSSPASIVFLVALWGAMAFAVLCLCVLIVDCVRRRRDSPRRRICSRSYTSQVLPGAGGCPGGHPRLGVGDRRRPRSWPSRSGSPPASTSRSSPTTAAGTTSSSRSTSRTSPRFRPSSTACSPPASPWRSGWSDASCWPAASRWRC